MRLDTHPDNGVPVNGGGRLRRATGKIPKKWRTFLGVLATLVVVAAPIATVSYFVASKPDRAEVHTYVADAEEDTSAMVERLRHFVEALRSTHRTDVTHVRDKVDRRLQQFDKRLRSLEKESHAQTQILRRIERRTR